MSNLIIVFPDVFDANGVVDDDAYYLLHVTVINLLLLLL